MDHFFSMPQHMFVFYKMYMLVVLVIKLFSFPGGGGGGGALKEGD